ncbi:MAG: hypothetical protein ABR582_05970 [Gemmatimonadaceae bacterium]
MATTVSTFGPTAASEARGHSSTLTAEWPIYSVVFASTCIVVGLMWDISWHRTIGRDTFFTPPHVLEQIAAIVAGLTCGYVVLKTTFAGSPEARAISVRYWRFFQGPLGAWVTIWATFTMITSAPLDDWWHNAYGLDVKILSPPHLVLAAGMIGIEIGAMLLVLGAQNRSASERDRRRLGLILAYAAAIVIAMALVIFQGEASTANQMHSSGFYKITAIVLPIYLVAFARSSRLKWAATATALFYMVFVLVNLWVIQLFPAQARLAPIYNPVTHMVPAPFPLLLVFPAICIDLLLQRFGNDRDWITAIAIGVSFVGVMLAAHWFWAEFLLSPHARNNFFAADKWDYNNRLGPWRYEFWNLDHDANRKFSPLRLALGIGMAMIYGTISARIGLWWGKGMALIKR